MGPHESEEDAGGEGGKADDAAVDAVGSASSFGGDEIGDEGFFAALG